MLKVIGKLIKIFLRICLKNKCYTGQGKPSGLFNVASEVSESLRLTC